MADDPVQVGFDATKLTFREMATFEDIAGVPVGALAQVPVPTARMLVAIVYIEMHRDNPDLTVDDVWEMNLESVDFSPTVAAPTPLEPLANSTKTRRVKVSSE